jgi:hypothetical protein
MDRDDKTNFNNANAIRILWVIFLSYKKDFSGSCFLYIYLHMKEEIHHLGGILARHKAAVAKTVLPIKSLCPYHASSFERRIIVNGFSFTNKDTKD